MCMSVFPTCVWVPLCVWCSQRVIESIRSPRTKVIDGGEPPNAFWEQKINPLKEHQVLLTICSALFALIFGESNPILEEIITSIDLFYISLELIFIASLSI